MEIKNEHNSAYILLFLTATERNTLFFLLWLCLSLFAPAMFVLTERFARGKAVKPLAL